ncbi:MAG: hypothetical protein PHP82_01715 [Candidatus ainarchaeum sp.]|nr:hypothetical protein [Candidatus ainarchaeum sp.]
MKRRIPKNRTIIRFLRGIKIVKNFSIREKVIASTLLGQYNSGREKNYYLYGKKFSESFPEKIIVFNKNKYKISCVNSLFEGQKEIQLEQFFDKKTSIKTARLCIGFEKNTLVIESIQGTRGLNTHLNKFRRIEDKKSGKTKGEHAFNFLLQQIESHAKKQGFKEVKIRVPESLYSYWFPNLEKVGLNQKQIQTKMKILYEKVATSCKYVRKGNFFVKKI